MDMSDYGPFANVVALASALVAVFHILALKMLGPARRRWPWLTSDSTPAFISWGPRIFAVAIMGTTYVLIDQSNFIWFVVLALLSGVSGFALCVIYDRVRKTHVLQVPIVDETGSQLRDVKGNLQSELIVIGQEDNMRDQAMSDWREAQKKRGGLTIQQFMAGYGASRLYDPEALWDRHVLARVSNRLTLLMMSIVLLAVLSVFFSAFVVEVR